MPWDKNIPRSSNLRNGGKEWEMGAAFTGDLAPKSAEFFFGVAVDEAGVTRLT